MLLHPKSKLCIPDELNLFDVPPTNASIINGFWDEVPPVSNIDEATPIEFAITGTGDYIYLSQCALQLSLKVVNADGSNLTDRFKVYPCNNFLHTLFSQVEMSMNNVYITTGNPNYAYRAYIETLFS